MTMSRRGGCCEYQMAGTLGMRRVRGIGLGPRADAECNVLVLPVHYCTERESGKVCAMQITQTHPTLIDIYNFRSRCNVQCCNSTCLIKRGQLMSDFKAMQVIKENECCATEQCIFRSN